MRKMVIIFTAALLIICGWKTNSGYAGDIILDWANGDTPGESQDYDMDGVHPNSGVSGTRFEFRIQYVSFSNTAPTMARLRIDRNGDGNFDDWNEDCYMVGYNEDSNYLPTDNGKIYRYSTTIDYEGNISVKYKFYFSNPVDGFAETEIQTVEIFPGDNYPRLTWTGDPNFVSDGVHIATDGYIFRIKYIDKGMDDEFSPFPPFRRLVKIDINDDNEYENTDEITEIFTMWDYNSASYHEGRIFEYVLDKNAITFNDNYEHSISYCFYFEDLNVDADGHGNVAIGVKDIYGRDPTNETANTFKPADASSPPSAPPTLYFYNKNTSSGIYPIPTSTTKYGGNEFTFKVTYTENPDKEPKMVPGLAEVWIDIDNNEKFDSFEKIPMTILEPILPANFANGKFDYEAKSKLYYYNNKNDNGLISYKFYFKSQEGVEAIDDAIYNGKAIYPTNASQDIDPKTQVPSIHWPGSDASSCVSIDPASGKYIFTIKYKDPDNVGPKSSSLYIDFNKDGDYKISERRTMNKDPDDDDFNDSDNDGGVTYTYSTSFDPNMITKGEFYNYRFLFHDGYNIATEEDPNREHKFQFINNAPTLTYADTSIIINGGDAVNFSVHYSDDENNPPTVREVLIYGYGDGDPENIMRIEMQEVDPNDHDCRDGKDYRAEKKFYYCGIDPANDDIITYTYHFKDKYSIAEDIGGGNLSIIVKEVGTIPELDWWGETGFENDGVTPDLIGGTSGTFKFKINYKDADNQAPFLPQVWIDTNNNGIYDNSGSERYYMYPSLSGNTFTEWRSYYSNVIISAIDYSKANIFHYRFYFNDGANIAQGPGAIIPSSVNVSINDPFIKVNVEKSRPELSWVGDSGYIEDGVEPETVQGGGLAAFRVKYRSIEGMAPKEMQVWIDMDSNDDFDLDEKYSMFLEGGVNEDPNYRLGVIYWLAMPIYYNGSNTIGYKFHFTNADYSSVGEPTSERSFSIEQGDITPQIFWGHNTVNGLIFDDNILNFYVRYNDMDDDDTVNDIPVVSQVWIDINQNDFYEEGEKIDMVLDEDDETLFKAFFPIDHLEALGWVSGVNLNYQFKFANQSNYAQGNATKRVTAFKEPTLSWSQADPNYIDKGVYPELARSGDTVYFRVSYEAESNTLLDTKQVWVWADTDNDGNLEIDEYIDMNVVDPNSMPVDYVARWETTEQVGGSVNYRFIFKEGDKYAVSDPKYGDSNGPAVDNQFIINRSAKVLFPPDSNTLAIDPNIFDPSSSLYDPNIFDPDSRLYDPILSNIDPNYIKTTFPYIQQKNGYYEFRVIYADADNDQPDPNIGKIYIDANTPISQSYILYELYAEDSNYKNGKVYTTDTTDDQISLLYYPVNNGKHTYRIEFYEGNHISAVSGSFQVPSFGEIPELSWPEEEGFDPNQAVMKDSDNESLFHFKIKYTDLDADPDKGIEEQVPVRNLLIDLNNDGSYDPSEIFQMEEEDPYENELMLGKMFVKEIDYTADGPIMYRFLFHDGYNIAKGAPGEDRYYDLIIPRISWADQDEVKDGIQAISWNTSHVNNFEFRIRYEDDGGTFADIAQVWIDINGNGEYENAEKRNMGRISTVIIPETGKRVSFFSYKLSYNEGLFYDSEKSPKYRFYFTNSNNSIAKAKDETKDPTKDTWPAEFGESPRLFFTEDDYPNGVKPEIGLSSDRFDFRVTYMDYDDDEPRDAQVWIYLDANADPILKRDLVEEYSTNDYSEGKDFYNIDAVRLIYDVTPDVFTIVKYKFVFNDYHNMATGTPTNLFSFVLNNHAPYIDDSELSDIIFKVGDRINIQELVLQATTDQDVGYGDGLTVTYWSKTARSWVSGTTLLTLTYSDLGEHDLLVKVKDFYGEDDSKIIKYRVSDIIGTIEGTVYEYGGVNLAVAGAQISAADPNQAEVIVDPNMISTVSDPNTGNFQLTLNEGHYKLIVSKPGYETEVISDITVVAGEDIVLSNTIFLNPYVGLINGWVEDEDRDILFAKVKVKATKKSENEDDNYSRSVYCREVDAYNPDRAYFNIYLPDGEYDLTFSGEDYKPIHLTNNGKGYEVNHAYFDPNNPITYPNPSKYSELGIEPETEIDWNITSYEVNVSKDPNVINNKTTIIIAQEGVIWPDIAYIVESDASEQIGIVDPNSKQLPEDDYTVPHYQIIYKDYAGEATGEVQITLKIPAMDKNSFFSYVTHTFTIHPDTAPEETSIWLTTQSGIDPDLGGIAGFDPRTLGQYFDSTYIQIPPNVISDDVKIIRIKRGAQRDKKQISYEYTIEVLEENGEPYTDALYLNEDQYLTINMNVDPNRWNGWPNDVEVRYYEDHNDVEWKTEGIDPDIEKIDNRTIAFKTNHLSTFSAFSIIPSDLEAKIRGSEIYLSWVDNSIDKTTGYRILRRKKTADDFVHPFIPLDPIDDPNITDYSDSEDLEKGVEYIYKVSAHTSGGYTSYSDTVTILYSDHKGSGSDSGGACFIMSIGH
ncbi:MAG: carboxypeptidase regulatory-like domain-containing protein [bacterium]